MDGYTTPKNADGRSNIQQDLLPQPPSLLQPSWMQSRGVPPSAFLQSEANNQLGPAVIFRLATTSQSDSVWVFWKLPFQMQSV